MEKPVVARNLQEQEISNLYVRVATSKQDPINKTDSPSLVNKFNQGCLNSEHFQFIFSHLYQTLLPYLKHLNWG